MILSVIGSKDDLMNQIEAWSPLVAHTAISTTMYKERARAEWPTNLQLAKTDLVAHARQRAQALEGGGVRVRGPPSQEEQQH